MGNSFALVFYFLPLILIDQPFFTILRLELLFFDFLLDLFFLYYN